MADQEEGVHAETAASMEDGTSGESREASQATQTITKRTPRMLHESSFATSSFTSNNGSRRPPGFSASSLDYKVNYKGDGKPTSKGVTKNSEKLLNPKPSNRKMQQRQQEEEKQKQQQQQVKPKKPTLPTRARGNYGPPPQQLATLEDLEHMSEDQLYRLFMEDPELYRTLLKSAGEAKSSSSSSHSNKRSRSNPRSQSYNKRSLQGRFGDDQEVPYFQWVVLLALMGAGLYHLRKTIMSDPIKQKRGSMSASAVGGMSKGKGGKHQKKQKFKKEKQPQHPDKRAVEFEESSDALISEYETKQATKNPSAAVKRPPASKKKKKPKQQEPSALPPRGGVRSQEKTVAAVSSGATKAQKAPDSVDMATTNIATDDDDDTWQTVAKTRGAKMVNNIVNTKAIQSNVDGATLSRQNGSVTPASEVSSVLKYSTKKNGKKPVEPDQTAEATTSINGTQAELPASTENKSNPSDSTKKKKKKKSKESSNNGTANKQTGSVAASSEDDAALALQLQIEEEILARAESNENTIQEAAWEEVTTKKKKW